METFKGNNDLNESSHKRLHLGDLEDFNVIEEIKEDELENTSKSISKKITPLSGRESLRKLKLKRNQNLLGFIGLQVECTLLSHQIEIYEAHPTTTYTV